jgi:tetratricopeptide (TPR) repeat protein
VSLRLQISAGEFFDIMRPAALVISALLSTWVLASARRHAFRSYVGAAWTLGTLFFPFIILPLYLIARSSRRRAKSAKGGGSHRSSEQVDEQLDQSGRGRVAVPLVYGLAVLSLIFVYLYQDYRSVDAHLARATYARLHNKPERAISEYRVALALEDNSHIHKLLGIVLAEQRRWTEALSEFRLAEKGGEPDETLSFRIATVLEALEHRGEASLEYERFLTSRACMQELPVYECETARMRLQSFHSAGK